MKEIEVHRFTELHEVMESYDIPQKIRAGLKKTLKVDRFALFPSRDRLSAISSGCNPGVIDGHAGLWPASPPPFRCECSHDSIL
jgi:hypothetical protein